jgi:hypothetical protein
MARGHQGSDEELDLLGRSHSARGEGGWVRPEAAPEAEST